MQLISALFMKLRTLIATQKYNKLFQLKNKLKNGKRCKMYLFKSSEIAETGRISDVSGN